MPPSQNPSHAVLVDALRFHFNAAISDLDSRVSDTENSVASSLMQAGVRGSVSPAGVSFLDISSAPQWGFGADPGVIGSGGDTGIPVLLESVGDGVRGNWNTTAGRPSTETAGDESLYQMLVIDGTTSQLVRDDTDPDYPRPIFAVVTTAARDTTGPYTIRFLSGDFASPSVEALTGTFSIYGNYLTILGDVGRSLVSDPVMSGFRFTEPLLVGDSGSGGVAGDVPAPAAGDAASNKFLSSAGGWLTPPTSPPPGMVLLHGVDGVTKSYYPTIVAALAAAVDGDVVYVGTGTYTENIVIPVGVGVNTAGNGHTIISAANPAVPAVEIQGGSLIGGTVCGTNAGVAAILCATAGAASRVMNVNLYGCGYGIRAESGALVFASQVRSVLSALGQGVGTAISVDGATTRMGVSSLAIGVAPALAAAYAPNDPITIGCECIGGRLEVTWGEISIPGNTAARIGLLCDDGGLISATHLNLAGAEHNVSIGSVGTGSIIRINGHARLPDSYNVRIQAADGIVYANAFTEDELKHSLTAGSKIVGDVVDLDEAHTDLFGDIHIEYADDREAPLPTLFNQDASSSVIEGGEVTDAGGLTCDVAAGDGWVRRGAPDLDLHHIEWSAAAGEALTLNTTNYVYLSATTLAVVVDTSAPGDDSIELAQVVTHATGIIAVHDTRMLASTPRRLLANYLQSTRKLVWDIGIAGSGGSAANKFDIDAGSYYRELDKIAFGGVSDATFDAWYTGPARVAAQTTTDQQYDNAGALAALPAGEWKSDTVYLCSDGSVHLVYGQANVANQPAAEALDPIAAPAAVARTACPIMSLIIQQGNDIVAVIDRRPDANAATAGGGGGAATNDHSALLNLAVDTHLQYMPTNGARGMANDLPMGGNNITGVGTVDGVTVSAHVTRHQPGGADALPTGAPVATGAANAAGSSNELARRDHVHQTGAPPSHGTTHNPDGTDGVTVAAPTDTGLANAVGSANSLSRSDHVHKTVVGSLEDHDSTTQPVSGNGFKVLEGTGPGSKLAVTIPVDGDGAWDAWLSLTVDVGGDNVDEPSVGLAVDGTPDTDATRGLSKWEKNKTGSGHIAHRFAALSAGEVVSGLIDVDGDDVDVEQRQLILRKA